MIYDWLKYKLQAYKRYFNSIFPTFDLLESEYPTQHELNCVYIPGYELNYYQDIKIKRIRKHQELLYYTSPYRLKRGDSEESKKVAGIEIELTDLYKKYKFEDIKNYSNNFVFCPKIDVRKPPAPKTELEYYQWLSRRK